MGPVFGKIFCRPIIKSFPGGFFARQNKPKIEQFLISIFFRLPTSSGYLISATFCGAVFSPAGLAAARPFNLPASYECPPVSGGHIRRSGESSPVCQTPVPFFAGWPPGADGSAPACRQLSPASDGSTRPLGGLARGLGGFARPSGSSYPASGGTSESSGSFSEWLRSSSEPSGSFPERLRSFSEPSGGFPEWLRSSSEPSGSFPERLRSFSEPSGSSYEPLRSSYQWPGSSPESWEKCQFRLKRSAGGQNDPFRSR